MSRAVVRAAESDIYTVLLAAAALAQLGALIILFMRFQDLFGTSIFSV
jgi:hypothetical protein